MITRVWHGRTKTEEANTFLQYVMNTGVPDCMKTKGNFGVQIWQEDKGGVTHFWMVTQWQNLDCIRSFAGIDVEKAKYYPEDERFLLELERNVTHYQTISFSKVRIQSYIRQLEQLYGGGSWNNESFTEKLKAVDEQKAFKQPVLGKHCIAEIVWHCIYWRNVLIKRIQGDNEFREKTFDSQNFLPLQTLKQKGWSNLLAALKQSQEALIDHLSSRNDDFLENEYNDGVNFEYLVEGLIHHDVYHLGQIGFVISLFDKDTLKPLNINFSLT